MSTLTDAPNKYLNEALVWEGHPALTQKSVTIVSGQNLKSGTILGKITSGGKFTRVNLAASDGSEVGVAVLAKDCDASGGDATALVYYQDVVFNGAELGYNTGATAGNKTTINAQLLAVRIGVVQGV